jgi:hypothetical protein
MRANSLRAACYRRRRRDALTGASEIVDVSMLGLDRFDESGRSRLAADPIALPFPEKTA